MTIEVIDSFTGRYRFLSNFSESPRPEWMKINGETFDVQTVEHAYQAYKPRDPRDAVRILQASTPGEAKKLGRRVALREDWEEVKIDVMRKLLVVKFDDPESRGALVETAPALLVEGNHWGDRFWGVCDGEGLNWLGLLLMEVRNQVMS